jgi:hypothetical protein
MAIAIVQASTPVETGSGLSATTVFGSDPTPGNAIIVVATHLDLGGTGNSISFADGVNSYTTDYVATRIAGGIYNVVFGSSFSVPGHATPLSVVATASSGTSGNAHWLLAALEVSGLAAFDQGQQNIGNPSTTPTTGSTGTLANANSLILAGLCANSAITGVTIPPTDAYGAFTDIIHDITGTGSNYGGLAYQLIPNNNAPENVAWGTIPSESWAAAAAVYKAAPVAIPSYYLSNLNYM